jgi:hypothetical protein
LIILDSVEGNAFHRNAWEPWKALDRSPETPPFWGQICWLRREKGVEKGIARPALKGSQHTQRVIYRAS